MTLTLHSADFGRAAESATSTGQGQALAHSLAFFRRHRPAILSVGLHALIGAVLLIQATEIPPAPVDMGAVNMVFENTGSSAGTSTARAAEKTTAARSAPGDPGAERAPDTLPELAQAARLNERTSPAASAPINMPDTLAPLASARRSITRVATPAISPDNAPSALRPLAEARHAANRPLPSPSALPPMPDTAAALALAVRAPARSVENMAISPAAPDQIAPLPVPSQPVPAASVPPTRPERAITTPIPVGAPAASAASTKAGAPSTQGTNTGNPATSSSTESSRSSATGPAKSATAGAPGTRTGGSGDIRPGFRIGSSGNPAPEYPRLARRRGQQGRVILRVEVDPAGHATSVAIHRSSGYRLLDRAAARTVRRWTFQPARRAGKITSGQVDVPVLFRLHD